MKKIASSSTHLPMTELGESHEQSVREASPSGDPHAIPASQEETNFWDGGIVGELQKNPLVSAHINAARNWSEIVFGKKGVLDTRIKEILENPSVSDRILYAISSNPQSIHKLAGQNICGFKTRARRNAMESLTLLHDALDGLAKNSESARSRIISSMGQSVREKPMEGVEAVESLLASYNHAKETCTLDKEMMTVLKKDPYIRKCEENIRYWCTLVFGHSDVLNEAIFILRRNPSTMLGLLRQLRETPETYHSLAGFNICGFKNRERREAEANMEELMEYIRFYCGVVHSAKKFLQIEHCEQQEHASILQNRTSEAVARNVQQARAEHHLNPQQEQPRRVESERMALTM